MALLTLRRAAAAAVLLAAGACELIPPPTYVRENPDQLLVHAVLQAGRDSVSVLVTRAGHTDVPVHVSGARVQVLGPGGAAVLAEAVAGAPPCLVGEPDPRDPSGRITLGPGCYSGVLPGGVAAGQEYRLEVELAGGQRVRGRTLVPAPPVPRGAADGRRLAGEQSGFALLVEDEPFHWTRSGNPAVSLHVRVRRAWAGGVQVSCSAVVGFRDDETGGNLARTDSARASIHVGGCTAGTTQVPPDSAELDVLLTSYDEAYVLYALPPEGGLTREQASAGVEGAFGVFGSASTAVRRVMLVPQDE